MTTTLYAMFDGEVLRPESALALTPNTRVRVTIEAGERPRGNAASFLRVAESLDPPPSSTRSSGIRGSTSLP